MRKTKEERQGELVYSQGSNKINVYEFNKGEKSEGKYITISGKETQITLYETEKTQVIACFIPEKNQINSLQIKKRGKEKNKCYIKKDISIQIDDIHTLEIFLDFLLKNDLNSLSKGRIELGESLEINEETIRTISLMFKDKKGYLELKKILEENITEEDIVCVGYRKHQLEIFKNMLEQNVSDEKEWQNFLEKNSWILGYGLDYRYLGILQREGNVGISTLNGNNSPEVDFLMGCNKFTVLVEVKTPETKLLGKDKNRANSWSLSKDLIYAHSQILAQKASREIESQNPNKKYNSKGELIKQETIDPKAILIIGNSKEFEGENLDTVIKRKTFELFRRNLKNIEILTYDELYERAKFIVNQNYNVKNEKNTILELPF